MYHLEFELDDGRLVDDTIDDTTPDMQTNLMAGGRALTPGQIDVILRSPILD